MATAAAVKGQGRVVLLVSEFATMIDATDQHVIDLIEAGQLGAIDIGLGSRRCFRIPITEAEKFMERRSSMNV